MTDDTQKPLQGVIMCCTSIPPEQRSHLAACAEEMGAKHKLDLTSDVTHLIVGDIDTPKYRYVAKLRVDVKCLLPKWVEAVRDLWLQGGETDVIALEAEHKLPTFIGLRICVTGFEDSYRKEMESTVNTSGGEYRANLTQDITHLIAKEPSGNKYKYAMEWGIKTVSIEWMEQSLERGMVLDESLYKPSLPTTERGRDAWVREPTSRTSLGKRPPVDDLGAQNSRKLRRTASVKLEKHNSGLWTDIVTREPGQQAINNDSWEEEGRPAEGADRISDESVDAGVEPRAHNLQEAGRPTPRLDIFQEKSQHEEKMFWETLFVLHGFDEKKSSILQDHLQSHGAEVVDTGLSPDLEDAAATKKLYLLVPHTIPTSDVPKKPSSLRNLVTVTELWIERCLYRKVFEDPKACLTNTSFFKAPISGFENLCICSTAFQGIELLHLSRAVKLIGAKYEEFFDANASVLVCNTIIPGLDKLRHAQLWRIPSVRAEWFWDCIRKSELLPFGPYLVQPIALPETPISDAGSWKRPDESRKNNTNNPNHSAPEPQKKTSSRKNVSKEKAYRHAEKDTSSTKIGQRKPDPFPDDAGPSPNTLLDDTARIIDTEPAQCSLNTNPTALTSNAVREITPNSSPSKPLQSPKAPPAPPLVNEHSTSPPPQVLKKPREPSPLGSTISSLLAHHQRKSSKNTAETNAHPRRRHRRLLGRAPSNLSSHSTINLSRASSVDTMNTDGLGTPLEAAKSTRPTINTTKASKLSAQTQSPTHEHGLEGTMNTIYDHADDDPDNAGEELQMTQLGYEDPVVAAWRERVAFKMGGGIVGKGAKGAVTPGKEKGEGRAGDRGGGQEGLGISKRTRLAVGGR